MPGKRIAAFVLMTSLFILPSTSSAKYTYQGSASQPLATIDPVVPGQVFKVWKPEAIEKGRWSAGTSADFLRNTDNGDDVDVILSVTGAYGLGDRLTVGGTFPYIIRDPEFNESDLLDLKAFARYRFTGKSSKTGVGAELLASFPTAAQGGSFPLTLDTTLLKLSFAVSGAYPDWDYGLNLGYQSYLESESGDDSDLFYGAYAGWEISSVITGILEYSASTHTHSEGSLEEKNTDATALVGVKYRTSDSLTLGLGIGSGLADSFADLRTQVTLVWLPGRKKAARETTVQKTTPAEETPEKVSIPVPPRVLGGDLIAVVKPGKGDVLVQISNRSGVKGLGEKVARHLEKAGYVIPVVEEGTGDSWTGSYIYYSKGNLTPATEIKLLFARPGTLTRTQYKLKGVGVLLVLGEDLAGWSP
ncbi:MAG: LytR C-terminal domain-containing protein [bacterium]|nr:LytR C-terminal domain-containing protein [bacterium]MDT8365578.1 LytR C-terminal domain-containing protein [bacterium]